MLAEEIEGLLEVLEKEKERCVGCEYVYLRLKKVVWSLRKLEEVVGEERLRKLNVVMALLLEAPIVLNLTDIGRRVGVSTEWVRQVRKELEEKGISIETERDINRGLLESVFPKVLELVEGGMSLREVCKRYGLNYNSVLRFFKRKGIDPLQLRREGLKRKILSLILEGKSIKEIAKELNLSYPHVQRIINSSPVLKEEYRKRERPRRFPKPPLKKRLLIAQLLKQGIPPSEIARSLDTYESYVHKIKAQMERQNEGSS